MSVSTTSNKITYSGNGATTLFGFTFPAVAAGDLQIYYTDTAGTVTLLASNLYSVALFPAVSPNPTAFGGNVTYPLVGAPIALGTSLTILRTLPDTQPVSFANQGTIYPAAIEQALDYLTMITQQLTELLGRQITVAVSDPTPAALPAVAQRASLPAIFDSSGNLTAGTALASGSVSAAMQPVINAATLALGRAAFGLGAMATEGIGAGLQDDGSGNARVIFGLTQTSINANITVANHLNTVLCTGALTLTLSRANTTFSGFGFWVYALTGAVTLAINVNDTFVGGSAGTSYIIPAGASAFITTNAAASGTWWVSNLTSIVYGLNAPLNVNLSVTVAANALTIALKTADGSDPATSDPVIIPFRDPTATAGDAINRLVINALSIVVPNGATLGTANGVPCRLWVVLFDNAGTLVLGVINCLVGGATPTQIFPLDETSFPSPTGISAASGTAGVYYAASGFATKAFRILGYIDFNAGQATAGAWATAPSKVQLFGPGQKKPGDTIQVLRSASGAVATGATVVPYDDTIPQSGEGDQYFSQAITAASPVNVFDIDFLLQLGNASNNILVASLYQDATANALASAAVVTGGFSPSGCAGRHLMLAGTAVATTFKVRAGGNAAGTTVLNGATGGTRVYGGVMNSYLRITEVMT